jgi:DNA invertase Pin-like site-specific DNA recombinase
MDRLARNLDDLRRIVLDLTRRGVRVEFIKEHLTFTGEDSPMANLMLSVMGAFAEFERALIRERQREGIAIAKLRGAYRVPCVASLSHPTARRQTRQGSSPNGAAAYKTGTADPIDLTYRFLRAGLQLAAGAVGLDCHLGQSTEELRRLAGEKSVRG